MLVGLSFPADNGKDQPWGQVQQKEETELISTPCLGASGTTADILLNPPLQIPMGKYADGSPA